MLVDLSEEAEREGRDGIVRPGSIQRDEQTLPVLGVYSTGKPKSFAADSPSSRDP